MTQRRQVSLPEELCASAEKRFGVQFPTVDLLLEFVLKELLSDEAEKLDQKEKAVLEQRLRDRFGAMDALVPLSFTHFQYLAKK